MKNAWMIGLLIVILTVPTIATSNYSFAITAAPSDQFKFANGPNELSVGYDNRSDTTILQVFTEPATITWNWSTNPPTPTWKNVGTIVDKQGVGLDPIGYSDPITNRYFNIQLLLPCSTSEITDNAGQTWIPTQLPCSVPGVDHETIGAGPYHQILPPGIVYPNAVYYCAQQGLVIFGNGLSYCARSDTGGLTWAPAIPMNTLKCYPLHGQIQVNPVDGTVFVPHKQCPDGSVSRLGVLRSEDNGLTWTKIVIPGTFGSWGDPKIRFSPDGTLWLAGISNATSLNGVGGSLIVATSKDNGNSWTNPVSLSPLVGNQNAEFPMLAVGSNGHAAVAWYGTADSGDDQSPGFIGLWYVYAAFANGDNTWSIVQVTPNPVQHGAICLGGIDCQTGRNLLDFQDATVDSHGRFIIAYADGCAMNACKDPNKSTIGVATIAQQTN